MVELTRDRLHASVWDPVASSMNFLNEVAGRYPDAISLAAGRPYDGFHTAGEVSRYLAVYQAHLAARGRTPRQVAVALTQYGRTNGDLGELIARLLAVDEGIDVPPDAIAVTAGCQEAMVIALRGLCAGPDDVVLAVDPCYVGLTGAARLLGVEVVPVPETAGGLAPATVAAVARRVRAAGRHPRALYLVPSFANPSGATLDARARREMLDVAGAEDLLILEDDPYGLFGPDEQPLPSLKSMDTDRRVVYLGSFAKSCFPGARVGFLVADQTVVAADGRRTLLAEELSAVKSMLTVNTSPISQAVIGGLLLSVDCGLRAATASKRAFYQRNLRALRDALDTHFPAAARRRHGVRWHAPDGGFFAVLDMPMVADTALLEVSGRRYGVLWTPMSFFYRDGGTRAIRLSYSAVEPPAIAEGVRRLAQLVADHG